MSVERYLKGVHGYSSRTIVKLKHYEQGMRLNEEHTRTIDLLRAGDCLQITFLDSSEHGVEHFIRSNRRVPVVYEDEDLLVFNKPADMPCHQSCGHAADTLANVFAAHCDRLGVDLMYPIRREQPEQMRRIVAPDGQRAVTNYRVLAQAEGLSLVDFVLETGRTHQIRVHMAHLGCPVLGDGMYGQPSDRIARQALHCRRICFPHPLDKREITVDCPLPQDMETLAEQILKG